ncbi:hypothetical protein A6A06_13575 [Streptomyces sp. CB02923]|uniref:hypothetical protein n=1 Tax=Streptomyces sp. CB02923 TaxID=1718985 RepID=UPI00093D2818|nr:hypothetical protein [Streptomyces sp. CB02923]OKI02114.1 hypothetical protein A6A06_13575 [Streptomyces sp. CB02923]
MGAIGPVRLLTIAFGPDAKSEGRIAAQPAVSSPEGGSSGLSPDGIRAPAESMGPGVPEEALAPVAADLADAARRPGETAAATPSTPGRDTGRSPRRY